MMKNNYKQIHKISKEKNKKVIAIITLLIILLIVVSLIFFIKNNNKTAKTFKIGNNSTSQEIVDYILGINSYECEVEVEVKSNKNINKYKIKQKYINNESSLQEILEPTNIKGIKIIRDGSNLKIENTKLSLIKIIEDYKEITSNNLDLSAFIDNYKNNKNSSFSEKNNQIIMETTVMAENNYQKYETLYVSKENGTPTKLEIKDTNQNIIIYIIYNEIKINKVANEKVYAFKLIDTSKEI